MLLEFTMLIIAKRARSFVTIPFNCWTIGEWTLADTLNSRVPRRTSSQLNPCYALWSAFSDEYRVGHQRRSSLFNYLLLIYFVNGLVIKNKFISFSNYLLSWQRFGYSVLANLISMLIAVLWHSMNYLGTFFRNTHTQSREVPNRLEIISYYVARIVAGLVLKLNSQLFISYNRNIIIIR